MLEKYQVIYQGKTYQLQLPQALANDFVRLQVVLNDKQSSIPFSKRVAIVSECAQHLLAGLFRMNLVVRPKKLAAIKSKSSHLIACLCHTFYGQDKGLCKPQLFFLAVSVHTVMVNELHSNLGLTPKRMQCLQQLSEQWKQRMHQYKASASDLESADDKARWQDAGVAFLSPKSST